VFWRLIVLLELELELAARHESLARCVRISRLSRADWLWRYRAITCLAVSSIQIEGSLANVNAAFRLYQVRLGDLARLRSWLNVVLAMTFL